MGKRTTSFRLGGSQTQSQVQDEEEEEDDSNNEQQGLNSDGTTSDSQARLLRSTASSPRWLRSMPGSDVDLRSRLPTRPYFDESSQLLGSRNDTQRSYNSLASSVPAMAGPPPGRQSSFATTGRMYKRTQSGGSIAFRIANALGSERFNSLAGKWFRDYAQFSNTRLCFVLY